MNYRLFETHANESDANVHDRSRQSYMYDANTRQLCVNYFEPPNF